MAEAEVSEQEEVFVELIGFLSDPKIAVQRLAAEALLEQTETLELIEYCKRKPRPIAKQLLRLAEKAEAEQAKADEPEGAKLNGEDAARAKREYALKVEALESGAAGAAALKSLVNLSAIPAVSAELVDMNAARRCCEALKAGWLEGRAELAHWHSMLLANLTLHETGQKALAAEEGHLRFLFSAYVSKARPPPRDGFDDPMLCLGKVINNVCALEVGRRIFAGGESGPGSMAMLAAELNDRQRRPDVVSAFRNVCHDNECHTAVISTDFFARLARFLYPWDKAAADRRAQLPDCLKEVLEADGATLTADISVRNAAAHSILGLCLGTDARTYLMEGGCYELLRAWHLEETDADTRTILESCVPYVSKPDEDSVAADKVLADFDALTTETAGYSAGEKPAVAPEASESKE